MIKKNKSSVLAFSMIEIMISIFIFSIGLVSIYSLIVSTMRINDYNKNYLIASNLAREQLELIRNIRDVNYITIHNYNQINPINDMFDDVFLTGSYYKISNNLNFVDVDTFPIKVDKISNFGEGVSELKGKMQDYRLCLDKNNIYTYDCSNGNLKTNFYKFIKVDSLKYKSSSNTENIKDAIKITSKVIWYKSANNGKGIYNEVEINTILADWKRL